MFTLFGLLSSTVLKSRIRATLRKKINLGHFENKVEISRFKSKYYFEKKVKILLFCPVMLDIKLHH